MQPSRQLAPRLLAKLNITFLDAVGSPARVLPYEFFNNFKARIILTAIVDANEANTGLHRSLEYLSRNNSGESPWLNEASTYS